jgi:hypothetical protein
MCVVTGVEDSFDLPVGDVVLAVDKAAGLASWSGDLQAGTGPGGDLQARTGRPRHQADRGTRPNLLADPGTAVVA